MRQAVFLLLLVSVSAAAQNKQESPYLIPPVVYVGDRATLVIPLAGEKTPLNSETSLDVKELPLSPDIDFHRVVLEHRPAGSRVLIEFSAFTPGLLELPPVEIGGERFAGLRIQISSILDPDKSDAVLSAPASPLAIPGTSLLVYGTLCAFAISLLLALWAGIRGRRYWGGWILKWKRRRLIMSMSGIEKHLRKTLFKDGKYRELLTVLSGEFRSFLSFFTGENCRSMTAAELGRLNPAPPLAVNAGSVNDERRPEDGEAPPELSGRFLEHFFRRCDGLRFSGSAITAGDITALLDDLRLFLKALSKAALGRAGRGKAPEQKEAA